MRKQLLTILCCGVALAGSLAAPILAQEEPTSASIDRLGWLAGCWRGDGGEECWLDPLGGSMVGINRGPERPQGDSRAPSFEFLRIVTEPGESGNSLVYLASPSGRQPPTRFVATKVFENRVVFENPEHDFPQRITYWREDADGRSVLHARVEARGEGDEWDGFELRWTRSRWSQGR